MLDYLHILGSTDFSPLGDLALRKAAKLAMSTNARLTALTVLPEPEIPSPLISHYEVHTDENRLVKAKEAAADALRDRIPDEVHQSGIQIDYVVRMGDPASEILAIDVQLHPDLIVLATHGRRGWRRWIMGSVSERVVQMAHADVLAVREHDDGKDEDEQL